MTAVTEVRGASARLFACTWRPLVSVITTLYYVAIIFIVQCGIAHFLCMYSLKYKFGHHLYPLGYLWA